MSLSHRDQQKQHEVERCHSFFLSFILSYFPFEGPPEEGAPELEQCLVFVGLESDKRPREACSCGGLLAPWGPLTGCNVYPGTRGSRERAICV